MHAAINTAKPSVRMNAEHGATSDLVRICGTIAIAAIALNSGAAGSGFDSCSSTNPSNPACRARSSLMPHSVATADRSYAKQG
jgi:hypothetical protein